MPLTALKVTRSVQPTVPPPTRLQSYGNCFGITMGQYNVENLSHKSTSIDAIADKIVTYLRSPDILFIQEIQDDNAPTNDGVVDANLTLKDLTNALNAKSHVKYDFIDMIQSTIPPPFNPGRIDPSNAAWKSYRKPLVAVWETVRGTHKVFTVTAYWTAKLGGSTFHSDARPPINGGVDQCNLQADNMGAFIADIYGTTQTQPS
ncbi:Hypothetical protein R9X50_00392700 [Acrodontium crateriforme]|uniref:Endonuclease/exonuclease/phosphatase domain-containing protein n=1 Tax=Acrodontium crateriforme TaxID=150365 RepID=A0AAQ3M3F3_9PEZI|nr:Hypothetical protein R9X50_00392700 [Acrodontium crateriforme]